MNRKLLTYKLFLESNKDIDPGLQSWLDETISLIEKDCKPFISDLISDGAHSKIYDGPIINISAFYRGVKDVGEVISEVSIPTTVKNNLLGGTTTYDKKRSISKKKSRKDRSPKDMGEEVTELFDESFYARFGLRPRTQGVFATGKGRIADAYGTPYLIFPIGDYKVLYSMEIEDLYTEVEDLTWFKYLRSPNIEMLEEIHDGDWLGHYENLKGKPFDDIIEYLKSEAITQIEEMVESYTIHPDLSDALDYQNEVTFFCDEYYLVSLDKKFIEHFYQN